VLPQTSWLHLREPASNGRGREMEEQGREGDEKEGKGREG